MPSELGRGCGEVTIGARRRRGRLLGLVLTCLIPSPAWTSASEGPPRQRTFEVTCRAAVGDFPEGAKALDLWLPLPQTDRNQTIHRVTIDSPNPVSIGREARSGNQCLHLRVGSPKAPVVVTLVIEATRREDAGSDEPLSDEDRARYLAAEPLVPLDGPVRALALEATRGLTTDAEKARAIYEKVVGMMRYDKSGTGWGRGDALFACDARRGNCTDFHALVIGMCRSAGIPARFAMKRPEKRAYFFGHHDEDRVEFSRGRHLTLVPAQQGPPLNFFVSPYAEVDGRPHGAIERKWTYIDRERPATGPGAGP